MHLSCFKALILDTWISSLFKDFKKCTNILFRSNKTILTKQHKHFLRFQFLQCKYVHKNVNLHSEDCQQNLKTSMKQMHMSKHGDFLQLESGLPRSMRMACCCEVSCFSSSLYGVWLAGGRDGTVCLSRYCSERNFQISPRCCRGTPAGDDRDRGGVGCGWVGGGSSKVVWHVNLLELGDAQEHSL